MKYVVVVAIAALGLAGMLLPATEPVTADAVPASELPPVAICPVVEVGERHTNLSVLSSVNGAGRLSTFSAGEVTGSLDFRTGGTGAVTVAQVVELLTPAEMDDAVKQTPLYRAPGR